MSAIAALFLIGAALSGATSISGNVVDSAGVPIAGAQVFLEPSYEAPLVETPSGNDGSWRFEGPYQGAIGIFAYTPGKAFGGATVAAGPNALIGGISIILYAPSSVSGRVVDARKKPVKDARVMRVGLLGATKVGIPLAKLKAHGFAEPVSGSDGRFKIDLLPEGEKAAIKVGHPLYAQEAVSDVEVGTDSLQVVMYEGFLVEGRVMTASGSIPVADVPVMVRSASPPHDTAVAATNTSGVFALRLKPGSYMCQVASSGLRSAGWQPLNIDPANPILHPTLYVAGAGSVRGKVCDAVTGSPVDGAKLLVNTRGNAAASIRTGPTGEFSTTAMSGENIVQLEKVAGYVMPEQASLTVQVGEGKDTVLPTFWLSPLPSYDVRVISQDGRPVAGAVVTLLRPYQFGWRVTGANGELEVNIKEMPDDGTVIGMVEHVTQPLGALFAIPKGYTDVATVQLFPLGTVRGQVRAAKGGGVEGAVVAALFGEYDLPLWRTVSGRKGEFAYSSVVPQVPQECVAYVEGKPCDTAAQFAVEVGGTKDLGALVVPEPPRGSSLMGKLLPSPSQQRLAIPRKKTGAAVVVYCAPGDADMVVEGLAEAKRVVNRGDIEFVAVIDGMAAPENPNVTVAGGKSPGTATTYVTGVDGKVVFETFGLPPLRALQAL